MGGGKKTTVGYWYKPMFHHGLGIGPIDAFLEYRGGDRTAWAGELTASGTIHVNAPYLFGGEKDQGGIVGDLDVMFGEADQMPNPYLLSVLGEQVPAWRGLATVVWKGGKYGAMNPYPQAASYKIRRIREGWDNDICWYPAKARIPIAPGDGSSVNIYNVGERVTLSAPLAQPQLCTREMAEREGLAFTDSDEYFWFWRANESGVSFIKQNNENDYDAANILVTRGLKYNQTALLKYMSGNLFMVVLTPTNVAPPAPEGYSWNLQPTSPYGTPIGNAYMWNAQLQTYGGAARYYMNPAHVLYDAATCSEMGREPIDGIDDASFKAGADWYFLQGFGICTSWDPAQESADDFSNRIQKLAGCSVTRSLVDGKLHLDVANGVYDLNSLPVLVDDDILDWNEQPSVPASAVNSLSVKYFDPVKKEEVTTPPVQALALIDAFGVIHQTVDYPEIPTAELALRVADRDLRATTTPLRAFDLKTTRASYDLRPNRYMRLQSPKRGIPDLVCIVGSKQDGVLKSGGIALILSQDIYTLPTASTVEVEPGVDVTPPQTPEKILLQVAFEAPYIDVVQALSRADLAVLPPDTGYLIGAAVDPATSRDFTMCVDDGDGEYTDAGNGPFCPSATVNEAADPPDTEFTLSNAKLLDQVREGDPVIWDNEWCRVDAIDPDNLTITLGRGCADTVPALEHAAGSRLFFYADHAAFDTVEYTDGELIHVKLLANTGSQQFAEADATVIDVEFVARQSRPYPPGKLQITDLNHVNVSYPSSCIGALTAAWAHRDRVMQADQLVDALQGNIGPEAGTTYTVRYYLNGVLDHTESDIAGTAATPYTLTNDGTARIEVESMRDGVASMQSATAEFDYRRSPFLPYADQSGNHYIDQDSNRYVG